MPIIEEESCIFLFLRESMLNYTVSEPVLTSALLYVKKC